MHVVNIFACIHFLCWASHLPVLLPRQNASKFKTSYWDYTKNQLRVFFYNSHRVKSSLLSIELSFRSLLQGRQTSK